MTTFTTSTRTAATVTAPADRIWETLTDPAMIARLTPFLSRVTAHGEHWVWEMTKVPVLGKSFSFVFTERMTFDEPHRIEFVHDPAAGSGHETAGVEGWYALEPRPEGTRLETSMEISVDLPFPGLTRPAVTAAMKTVVTLMGQRFAQNLLQHLHARSV